MEAGGQNDGGNPGSRPQQGGEAGRARRETLTNAQWVRFPRGAAICLPANGGKTGLGGFTGPGGAPLNVRTGMRVAPARARYDLFAQLRDAPPAPGEPAEASRKVVIYVPPLALKDALTTLALHGAEADVSLPEGPADLADGVCVLRGGPGAEEADWAAQVQLLTTGTDALLGGRLQGNLVKMLEEVGLVQPTQVHVFPLPPGAQAASEGAGAKRARQMSAGGAAAG